MTDIFTTLGISTIQKSVAFLGKTCLKTTTRKKLGEASSSNSRWKKRWQLFHFQTQFFLNSCLRNALSKKTKTIENWGLRLMFEILAILSLEFFFFFFEITGKNKEYLGQETLEHARSFWKVKKQESDGVNLRAGKKFFSCFKHFRIQQFFAKTIHKNFWKLVVFDNFFSTSFSLWGFSPTKFPTINSGKKH